MIPWRCRNRFYQRKEVWIQRHDYGTLIVFLLPLLDRLHDWEFLRFVGKMINLNGQLHEGRELRDRWFLAFVPIRELFRTKANSFFRDEEENSNQSVSSWLAFQVPEHVWSFLRLEEMEINMVLLAWIQLLQLQSRFLLDSWKLVFSRCRVEVRFVEGMEGLRHPQKKGRKERMQRRNE